MDVGEDEVIVVLRDLGADDRWIYRHAVVTKLGAMGCDLRAADALLDQMIDAGKVRRHPMEWNEPERRVRLP